MTTLWQLFSSQIDISVAKTLHNWSATLDTLEKPKLFMASDHHTHDKSRTFSWQVTIKHTTKAEPFHGEWSSDVSWESRDPWVDVERAWPCPSNVVLPSPRLPPHELHRNAQLRHQDILNVLHMPRVIKVERRNKSTLNFCLTPNFVQTYSYPKCSLAGVMEGWVDSVAGGWCTCPQSHPSKY